MLATAYVWSKTLLYLIEKLDPEIDYSEGLDLVEINDSHLILHISTPAWQEAIAAQSKLIEQYLLDEFHLRRKLLILDDAGLEERKQNPTQISNLNDKYTLDTYVAGSSNRRALDTVVAAAEGYAALNPLFLYGPSGCGKTHLLHAIANHVSRNYTDCKIVYTNSDQFTADLIYSLKNETPAFFTDKYCDADLLLVDDLQFLAGRGSTQQVLSETCCKLLEAGKQVVLSADCAPDLLPYLDDMWKECAVEVFLPDYETRQEIIRNKASALQLPLTEEMTELLARMLCDNVHQIEGGLKRILAQMDLTDMELTMDNLAEVLDEI